MSPFDSDAAPPDAGTRTFSYTYGASHTAKTWPDRRATSWPVLVDLLTKHRRGRKEGSCIVPATFRSTCRHKADADQIDLVVLDADCGHTLEEIEAAVRSRGWAAIIHSTHSHLTTHTTVKRAPWDKALADSPIDAEQIFLIGKGYLPRVAEGAHIVNETGEEVTFWHQPCPKFRVVLRLARPWRAADHPNQDVANAAWKERIEALAGALGLRHDQSCTDTSRLFYLPRHPGDPARPPVASVIKGADCDLWSLPARDAGLFADKQTSKGKTASLDTAEYSDPDTGETIDLRAWAREWGKRFEIVTALKARKPEVFIGHVAEGTHHHLRCVNEDAHTTAGTDRATFVVNASEASNKGFVYHCRHAHCTGHDRLFFVRRMLERGWLKIEDLVEKADDGTNTEAATDADTTAADAPAYDTAEHAARIGALLTEFNKRYMVVIEAGKTTIYKPERDPILNRRFYDRMSFTDLRNAYLNRVLVVGANKDGSPIYKKAADIWLEHRNRRQFIGGVTFDPSGKHVRPDMLNLWQGFGVTPRPGKWERLKSHIYVVLCGSQQELYDYLMNWMARLVQFPAQQGEVAIVMRGGEGTGKGTLAKVLRHIMGQHGMVISNSKHLTGNFNGHLRDCVFLFADEAFYAGDPSHVGVLKSIITEPHLTIEAKFANAVQMPNFLHLMMASNEEWVVPASLNSRRFLVLQASGTHANDHACFGAIWEQMEAGGYEAMLHELLHHDLTGFNVRRVPVTEGLQEQRKLSLGTSPEAWWSDVLHRGYVWKSRLGLESYFGEWHDVMTTEVLFTSYADFARTKNERHPLARETFGRFMVRMGAAPTRPVNEVVGERIADVETAPYGDTRRKAELLRKPGKGTGYNLGTLAHARAAFDGASGLKTTWPDDGPEPEPEPGWQG